MPQRLSSEEDFTPVLERAKNLLNLERQTLEAHLLLGDALIAVCGPVGDGHHNTGVKTKIKKARQLIRERHGVDWKVEYLDDHRKAAHRFPPGADRERFLSVTPPISWGALLASGPDPDILDGAVRQRQIDGDEPLTVNFVQGFRDRGPPPEVHPTPEAEEIRAREAYLTLCREIEELGQKLTDQAHRYNRFANDRELVQAINDAAASVKRAVEALMHGDAQPQADAAE